MKTIKTINPATEEILHEYQLHSESQVDEIISLSKHTQQAFRESSLEERAGLLISLAAELRAELNPLAELITSEMGKPIAQSKAEVEKCAWLCEYYAEKGAAFLADIEIKTDASKSFVAFQPLGLTLGIMPWNFPFWQVFRCSVPALMAGNGAILKHASNVTGCSLVIERLFEDAGFPKNLFRSIIYPASDMEFVIGNPEIKTVSITGSTIAGKNVAALSGKYLKKCVLELGGSDPYIILADADINLAAKACAKGRLLNGGQSCIAAKRFIVCQEIYNDFTEKLISEFSQFKTGNPFQVENTIGPLAKKEFVEEISVICEKSEVMGAKLLYKEAMQSELGYYFTPRVYGDVTPEMPLFNEETFGPVAVVVKAADSNDAIRLANFSQFGLGGAVFTSDSFKGELIAKNKIEAGSVFVNDFVRSDPRLPFGGINESGYGRELSEFGIREFTNIKTVYIK